MKERSVSNGIDMRLGFGSETYEQIQEVLRRAIVAARGSFEKAQQHRLSAACISALTVLDDRDDLLHKLID